MPVTYGNLSLEPAPFVELRKSNIVDAQGNIISPDYVITLKGTIVAVGSQSGMDNVRSAQDSILDAFATNGHLLTISAPDGGTDLTCCPTVEDVSFAEGTWYNRCDYTITLRANDLGDDGPTTDLRSFSESWQISEQSNGVYAISHSLNAVGLNYFVASGVQSDALGAARTYVSSRLVNISDSGGYSTSSPFNMPSGALSDNNGDVNNYWNYSLVENIGNTENSWQATESFIYYPSGTSYREEWTLSIQEEESAIQNKLIATVQGTIFGFAEQDNNGELKYTNALAGWATVENILYTRVLAAIDGGYTLDPTPTSKTVTHDEINGTVGYSINYRAIDGVLVANALEEELEVTDIAPNDVFAEIQVPGRTNGPVVQYMGTKTLPQRSVSYSGIFSNDQVTATSVSNMYLSKPVASGIFEALAPSSVDYYISSHQETWNPIRRSYNRSITWVIVPEGTGYNGELSNSGLNNP